MADWWRLEVSDVGAGVYVTGAPTPGTATHAVTLWAELEVECVLDLTEYGFVESLPASVRAALSMPGRRHRLPMVDPCPQPPAGLVAAAVAMAGDLPTLVHCHMGVNRAPSVALAVLLARGVAPDEALEQMCSLRPVAAVRYAPFVFAEHWGCALDDPRVQALQARRAELVARYRTRLRSGSLMPPFRPSETGQDPHR